MAVPTISASCRLLVRVAFIETFSEEDGRNPSFSSASPIVALPSSEEFRDDNIWYFEVTVLKA